MKKIVLLPVLAFCFLINYVSTDDLTRQDPIVKTILLSGIQGEHHFYEPKEIIFNTGKLYKLIIKNMSDSKHYFTSNAFSKAIFTRKIQINNKDHKLAEIKGVIHDVEVWPNQQIEWWVVPIKTGYFNDLHCKVKDKKSNLTHDMMGMKGVIIIK